ncbi:TPA: hypothetical protein HA251_02780 [Candidatus Woesearchaeota archaeon]|nr:hypothetical protein [Candidatus Woesearchaeota archaeon]
MTKVNKMKTLQAIVLATAIGATACGPPYTKPENAPSIEVIGVPMTMPERSVEAHSSAGSYTFLLKTTAPSEGLACAYRYGPDAFNVYQTNTNQQLEYESSVVKAAAQEHVAVSFESVGKTPQGCYVVSSVPKLR